MSADVEARQPWRVAHGWSGYTDHENLADALAQMARLLAEPVTSPLFAQVALIDTTRRVGTTGYHPTVLSAERPVVART